MHCHCRAFSRGPQLSASYFLAWIRIWGNYNNPRTIDLLEKDQHDLPVQDLFSFAKFNSLFFANNPWQLDYRSREEPAFMCFSVKDRLQCLHEFAP